MELLKGGFDSKSFNRLKGMLQQEIDFSDFRVLFFLEHHVVCDLVARQTRY